MCSKDYLQSISYWSSRLLSAPLMIITSSENVRLTPHSITWDKKYPSPIFLLPCQNHWNLINGNMLPGLFLNMTGPPGVHSEQVQHQPGLKYGCLKPETQKNHEIYIPTSIPTVLYQLGTKF
jgi:hypothetical protein